MGFSKGLDPRLALGHLLASGTARPLADACRLHGLKALPVPAAYCLLGGSACVGRCVGNTSSGKAQEGAAPHSGPGMRARPLAKRLQTAVFESTRISYYLQYNLPRGILPAKACRRTILPRVRA